MKTTTKWAIGVTVIWVGGIAAYVFWKWDKFLTMDPNAVGDFLAGTVSPLALFWLVAGYRQQGEELALNTEALLLQQKELANQVAETKQLAIHSGQQAEAAAAMVRFNVEERFSREAAAIEVFQPKFRLEFLVLFEETGQHYTLTNIGKEAHLVELKCEEFETCEYSFPFEFVSGDPRDVFFNHSITKEFTENFQVTVNYVDIQGTKRFQSYHVKAGVSYPNLAGVLLS